MITVLYFGRLGDLTGTDCEPLDLPPGGLDVAGLRSWIDETKSLDGALLDPTIRIAVNGEIVIPAHPVQPGDEVAFLPIVSGG